MKRCVLAIGIGLAAMGANAGPFVSGNLLYSKMTSDDPDKKLFAIAFVIGVADAIDGVDDCAPDGVSGRQVYDVVHNFLRDNPQDRNYSASSIESVALRNVWPCPKPTPETDQSPKK